MASFTIGDYNYTTLSGQKVLARAADTTKTAYANVPTNVTYGGVTYSVTDMSYCFQECTSLVNAPSIPSGVTDIHGCFHACFNLTGNIRVSDNPEMYDNIFMGTSNDIFIIPNGLSSAAISKWRNIASGYSNVHYYGDDAVLNLESLQAKRVASTSSFAEDDIGQYAYVNAMYKTGGYIPVGMTQNVTLTMTRNGSASTPERGWLEMGGLTAQSATVTPTPSSSGTASGKYAWFAATSTDTHVFKLTISDNFGNSSVLSVTLPKAGALLDFHAGGDGMAIGTVSTGPGLVVAMDSDFTEPVDFQDSVSANGEQCYPTFLRSSWSASSDVSELATLPCLVLNTTDNTLWYCTSGGSVRLDKVTGVKGNAESSYRTGNVNLTPANVGAVAKSGDTMTGNLSIGRSAPLLNLKNTDVDMSAANNGLSSGIHYPGVNISDNSDRIVARLEAVINSSGNNGFNLYARNYDTSGTQTGQKGISGTINKSGTMTYSVSDPANFRSAISAVNKAGDTMTGNLHLQQSAIDRDAANPSADQWSDRTLILTDTNGETLAQLRAVRRNSTGRIEANLRVVNEGTDGTAYENNFYVGVLRDGTKFYAVSDAAKFRSDLGIASRSAINSISRSGTTFTATRENGTTFTFTQQDSYPAFSSAAATKASYVGSSAWCTWNKFGRVVIISFWGPVNMALSTYSSLLIASNIPKSNGTEYQIPVIRDGDQQASYNLYVPANSTQLKLQTRNKEWTSGGTLYGTLCYMSAS